MRPDSKSINWRRAIAVLLLSLGLLLFWLLVLRPNIHTIIPGQAYRSAQLSGGRLESFTQEVELKTVINLRPPDAGEDWYREELETVERLGLEYHTVPMFHGTPRADQVQQLARLIETVERPFLVHCRAGADRTGLAAVITLLLQGEVRPEEISRQVSWRFGAIRADSMGAPFLEAYRDWLAAGGQQHSPDAFRRWLREGYVDETGGIHFLVHPIRGQAWYKPLGGHHEGVRFDVDRRDGTVLELDGWAYDGRQNAPLKSVRVYLGAQALEGVEYGLDSAWLADQFGAGTPREAGWRASGSVADLPAGCLDLSFEFERADGSKWVSPPAGRICLR